MLALLFCTLYVVTARYVFNSPPLWGEDVPRVIFLWGVFLSAPLAMRFGLNIRANGIDSMLPPRVLRVLKTVLHLIVLALLAVIIWNALPIVKLALRGTMLSTGWSNAVLRLPILVGTALMFVAQLEMLVDLWRRPRR